MSENDQSLVKRDDDLSPAAQMFQNLANVDWKSIDVEKMKVMLEVQERMIDRQAKEAFNRAFAQMQPELPVIDKNGTITDKHGKLRSRYSLFEDIMAAIAEPLKNHGFTLTFNTPDTGDPRTYKVTCELVHMDGYSKPYEIRLPIDTSEFRSAVQNSSSTISFGKRQLVKMALNLVEKGEGIGAGPLAFITPEQLKDLQTMIADGKADLGRFLTHFRIAKLEELSVRDYKEAASMLAEKVARRQQEAQEAKP
jgi:hypothetical protein